jgi:queuine tRNA-ribosyltransferase
MATEHALSFQCDGIAIGGLSVGEPAEVMYEILETITPLIPDDTPRYLMGVGTPVNLLEGIARGVDMFDCVMPSRNGRNGTLFTWDGVINIRNKKWADDLSPIDPKGTSFVDSMYTKAYLRHLFISGEMLGPQIASLHNLAFYLSLMEQSRRHIEAGDFMQWKNAISPNLSMKYD